MGPTMSSGDRRSLDSGFREGRGGRGGLSGDTGLGTNAEGDVRHGVRTLGAAYREGQCRDTLVHIGKQRQKQNAV